MQLRGYQQAAVASVYQFLREKHGNPVVVIPTGGGKTPVIATICRDAAIKWNSRVILLAHVKELLEQNSAHLTRLEPALSSRIGIYSAGLGSKDASRPITVAGIQSVYDKAANLEPYDLVLIDEVHRTPPEGEGMYRTFLKGLKERNPKIRAIGFTATPYRTTSGLVCSPENIFNEVCYEVGIRELVNKHWLTRLISYSGSNVPNTDELHVRAGEFIAAEMEAMMNQEALVRAAVSDLEERAKDRKSVLVFTSGLAHAAKVVEALKPLGEVGLVTGNTESKCRAETIERFKSGQTRFLVNVNVLTEGFDHPGIDCVVLLRATMSPGLFYQMVGRGLRLAHGKENCLILDFGNNIIRHGPIDMIKVAGSRSDGRGKGEPPGKKCPQCLALIYSGYAKCPMCGFEFPRKFHHETRASAASIMSDGQPTTEILNVLKVNYYVHVKKGADEEAPRTLRVEYKIGYARWISEWVCFEHNGWARQKAESWWRQRSKEICPKSVGPAFWAGKDGELLEPGRITVATVPGEKYGRIVGYDFETKPEWTEHVTLSEDENGEYEEVPF